jgi:hypothetical protein
MNQELPLGVAASHSDLLSRTEAAAYLGIAKQTLAIWACERCDKSAEIWRCFSSPRHLSAKVGLSLSPINWVIIDCLREGGGPR